jgi:N-acetylglucosamine-6-phosphate deacetylase
MRTTALAGARIFDGSRWHDDSAVLMLNETIVDVVPAAEIPPDAVLEKIDGGVLAPGFIDAQVNGGGGVLFNDTPTGESMD